MAEEGGEGGGGLIATIFGSLFSLLGEAFGALIGVIPKIVSFLLWVLVAIIVLPCVWVAGSIYPLWEKWGEGF